MAKGTGLTKADKRNAAAKKTYAVKRAKGSDLSGRSIKAVGFKTNTPAGKALVQKNVAHLAKYSKGERANIVKITAPKP